MTTTLNFAQSQGFNTYAADFSDENYTASLVNGSEQTITVPSDAQTYVASFSYQPGTVVWVSKNATASVPAGSSFAASDSTLNPGTRKVYAGDVLHLITATATAEVSVTFYAFGNQV